jgi:ribosomal protein L11 methyltransferase
MSNRWWEIAVSCEPSLEESVFWRLDRFGCSGTATELQGNLLIMRAYIPEIKARNLDLAALSLWLQQDAVLLESPEPVTEWRSIEEEDWSSSWKQHWAPTEIGERFLIYPAWLEVPENVDRLILRIDPGSAFGTGTHATTQLCLESLEMRLATNAEGQSVADIGCGSGILSIGSVLLGARKVYAVDTDPLAITASRSNRHLNRINPEYLSINQGSAAELLEMIPDGVNGIVCNILAETIVDILPGLTLLAKPKSWGVLSGIILDRVDRVVTTLEECGWEMSALRKRGEWCCINMRRSENS